MATALQSVRPEKIAQPLSCFHKNRAPSTGATHPRKPTCYSQRRKEEVIESTGCLFSHPSSVTWKDQHRHTATTHHGRDSKAHCVTEELTLDLESRTKTCECKLS